MFICKYCGKEFYRKDKRFNKFCSQSCSAKYNNRKRKKSITIICLNCGNFVKSSKRKYCSIKCQKENEQKQYIEKWLRGEVSGGRGKGDYQISRYIRKYLLEENDYKCSICGWNKINPYTGIIPVEIDHIDGNWKNNNPENLRVLCPSCHSLTPNFRAKNIGKGRGSEMRGSRLYRKE